MESIVHSLQHLATTQPDKTVFISIDDDTMDEQGRLTYAELDRDARRMAVHLLASYSRGDRAALVYPTGLEFVSVFFGCLYAGIIPVPLYPPSGRRPTDRISRIVSNADCSLVLTTSSLEARLQDIPCQSIAVTQPVLNAIGMEEEFKYPMPSTDDVAFLQYTSGSTGNPKGVIVSHGNIIYNTNVVGEGFCIQEDCIGFGWLPLYHDMGLVGLILQTVFSGITTALMSPSSFLRSPMRWLKCVSQYKATISGGPNFAFDLCTQKFSPETCGEIDLRSWKVAFCGAEPIRAETARKFIQTFEPFGFNPNAFYPCYGMAESTLFLTGGYIDQMHNTMHLDREQLSHHLLDETTDQSNATEIVSCGRPRIDTTITIVDPETRQALPEDRVGEIWVQSDNVGLGYWADKEKSEAVFRAFTNENVGPCMRTGDYGYLHGGELYVTGRLKDTLIIRGRNYYPQDIEATAGASHAVVHEDRAAAFIAELADEPRLVVVAEVQRQHVRKLDGQTVVDAIRNAIADTHGLTTYAVAIVGPGQLPRTSSGKIRRSQCRALYESQELNSLHTWEIKPQQVIQSEAVELVQERSVLHTNGKSHAGKPAPDNKANELIAWLRDYSSRRINSRLMDERRCITPSVVLDFGNQGLFGMTIPTQYDGLGMSEVEALRVFEQLGAIDISLASMVGIHLALGAYPIVHHAKSQIQERVLPQLATGRQLGAFAITEPAAGSNPRGMRTTATPHASGGWLLNGDKSWIGNAAWAGVINVFARVMDDSETFQGIAGFVVDHDNPGLHIGEEALTMGVRGMVQNSVHLRQAPVTKDACLGEPGNGFSVARDAMNTGRLGISAMCVGALRFSIQLMHRYASRRTISSGLLLNHPVTLDRLAAMDASATAVEALTHKLASLRDHGKPVPEFAYSACKIAGPELLWQGVDWAAQALAGRGYTENNDMARLLRDARLLRIFEGPTETLTMHIGQVALRQSNTVIQFFIDGFESPRAAELYKRIHREVAEAFPEAFRSGSSEGQRVMFLFGQLVTWVVMDAALESARDSDSSTWARTWLQQKIDNQLQQLRSERRLKIDEKQLIQRVGSYSIGVEQRLPGEQLERDPLLSVDLKPEDVPANSSTAIPTDESRDADTIPEYSPAPLASSNSETDLQTWIIGWVSQTLDIEPSSIGVDQSLIAMGLDSVTAVDFVLALEEKCGYQLPIGMLWELPSIAKVVEHLEKSGTPEFNSKCSVKPIDETIERRGGSSSRTKEEQEQSTSYRIIVNENLENRTEFNRHTNNGRQLRFSLYFFGSDENHVVADKYRLILEAARRADNLNLDGLWLPERHFHSFGAAFPNPAMLGSAIVTATQNLHIRSGSVVLPLHNPITVVENWAVLDLLSNGRTGLGLTAGWNPDDFVLDPDSFSKRFEVNSERIDTMKRLWRGESIRLPNGEGKMIDVQVHPQPLQPELPLWLTCNRRRESFMEAGSLGANVLTGLIAQTPDELAEKITLYRETRTEHGYDPNAGRVTTFLHTFINDDAETLEAEVREPLMKYLNSSLDLYRRGIKELDASNPDNHEQIMEYAYQRYRRTSTLIGSTDECREIAQGFFDKGVDEIACLVDFGLPFSRLLEGLDSIGQLAHEFSELQQQSWLPENPIRLDSDIFATNETEHIPWVVTESPRPESSMRLICLPYAGGDASVFQKLGEEVSESVEVVALNAPQKIQQMDDLLAKLVPEIEPLLDRPYAIYGHSVGALIAFELVRKLREFGKDVPEHLFVGAQRAPDVAIPFRSFDELMTAEGMQFLETQVSPKSLSKMTQDNPELLKRMLAPIEAGTRIQCDNYTFNPGEKLACPITAFYGKQDRLLEHSHMEAWASHTSSEFTMMEIDGGHLFIQDHVPFLVEQISQSLKLSVSTPG